MFTLVGIFQTSPEVFVGVGVFDLLLCWCTWFLCFVLVSLVFWVCLVLIVRLRKLRVFGHSRAPSAPAGMTSTEQYATVWAPWQSLLHKNPVKPS